jgi:hypothetical protein
VDHDLLALHRRGGRDDHHVGQRPLVDAVDDGAGEDAGPD